MLKNYYDNHFFLSYDTNLKLKITLKIITHSFVIIFAININIINSITFTFIGPAEHRKRSRQKNKFYQT